MSSRLDMDRLFNRMTPARSLPKPGTAEARESFYALQNSIAVDTSPSGSSATLVSEDDEVDLFNTFKKCDGIDLFAAFKPTLNELSSLTSPQADLQRHSTMNERSKGFFDEFQERNGQQAMPAEVGELLAATDFPIYRRSPPSRHTTAPALLCHQSSPSRTFNPHAAPFIPACTRQQISSHEDCASPLDDNSQWFPAFWAGATASDPQEHELHASNLISSREWTAGALAELAQHFCWKGGEGDPAQSTLVASFARVTYSAFKDAESDERAASCFAWHIRECVMGTFKACWKSGQPQAITMRNAPIPAYLSSALCLASFIGDLFNQDLLPITVPHSCLTLLLSQLASIEHVHAIYALLLHANQKLWMIEDGDRAIKNFVTSFTQRSSTLSDISSVTGVILDQDEIQKWASDVVEMVHRWQSWRVNVNLCESKDTQLIIGTKLFAVGLDMGKRR